MNRAEAWAYVVDMDRQLTDHHGEIGEKGRAVLADRLAEVKAALYPEIDYKAGCREMQDRSHGWQTCDDDGDLESFTAGVNVALGMDP